MNITIIGAGYVGLTSAALFAKLGHKVRILEKDAQKVARLKIGKALFYEPGLDLLISSLIRSGALVPIDDYADAIVKAEVIFICVGTPPRKNGQADLSQIFSAAQGIACYIKNGAVVAIKSTVPVGTAERVKKIIQRKSLVHFEMASCPEFLREGSALADTQKPDRVVIGVNSEHARKVLIKLHEKLPGERVVTDLRTAEIIKYASNAFLATKISFINEIANLCEAVKANVDDVALGMGLDPRIGKAFLKAGIGYGGSCFPKDTRALNSMAKTHYYDFKLLKAVIEVNQLQRKIFMEKVRTALGSLRGKKIGVLGLAFKNNTDDVRESAALEIIKELLKKGARVTAYDPQAASNAKKVIPKLIVAKKPGEVANNADVILILTEWPEFRTLRWDVFKKKMHRPLILDGRNLLDQKTMLALGFEYISMGR